MTGSRLFRPFAALLLLAAALLPAAALAQVQVNGPLNANIASTAAGIGTAADAEAATGNGSVIALSKAQRTIMANLLAAYGAPADAAATATGANGSVIALTKALRDRLNGTLTVGGTVTLGAGAASIGSIANTAFGISGALPAFAATPTVNLGTLGGAATATNQASALAALGAPADAAYAGSGSSSIVAALKGVYSAAAAPTPAGTNVIGRVGIDQTTPGTTNRVFLSAAQPAVATTAAIGANATASGTYFSGMGADGTFAYPYAYFTCATFADQPGTLFVEASIDNATFFPRNGAAGTAVAANASVEVKVALSANVMRCRYVNGSTAQTKFFLASNPSRY